MRMYQSCDIPDDLKALAGMPTPYRVQNRMWRGRQIWIKRADPPQSRLKAFWRSALSLIVPVPALRPGLCPGGALGILREARAMEKLRREGFVTPDVIAVTDDWLALEDLGVTVDTYLKTHPALTEDIFLEVVRDCARELARMHAKGLHHGRGKYNDFIRTPDGRIGFIDFEEDLTQLPSAAVEARELWMMVSSITYYQSVSARGPQEAMAAYRAVHQRPETKDELKKLLRAARPFAAILRPFRDSIAGDIKRFYATTLFFLEDLA